jgi:F-type H+-transporting ATPase subunit b
VRHLPRYIPQPCGASLQALVALPMAASLLALAAPAHASGGELVLIPDPTTIVILVIVFALLIFPVNALLFKPVFRVLDRREDKIGGARRRAEHLEREADEVLSEYEGSVRAAREQAELERRERIDEARSEHTSVTGSARDEAEREIERARAELGRSLVDARAALRSQAEDLAQTAAERVLGRSLS